MDLLCKGREQGRLMCVLRWVAGSVVMLGVVWRGACRGRERQREAEREGMCFQLRVDQTLVGV